MPRTPAIHTSVPVALLATLVMAGLSMALSLAASAQSNDLKYCQALLTKYDAFIVKASGHSPRRGDTAAEVAAAKCRDGDPSGISELGRALQNAKIELPPRW